MHYTRLGKTGLKVSKLCFGCMSFGQPGWSVHPWVLDEKAGRPFIKSALDKGINFFDTSDFYSTGVSEEILGRALKDFAPSRAEVVIATKVALAMGDAPNMGGLSRKHIIEGVDASLKRLGTDYIDLLYIHRLDPDTEMDEVVEALEHVVKQGKALYLGASSTWTWQFVKMREMQKARGYSTFMAMQNFYNLAYREEEREMIPYCIEEGIGLVPWSPIARGFLAGNRPKEGEATARAKTDKLAQGYFGTKQDYAILARVEKIAAELGVKPAQVAYAWVLSKPFIASPIIGATKMYQLDDAVAALDIKLTNGQIKRLEAPYQPRAVMGHS